ncbi:MAG: phenylalanine--tRNA ligase subunit alpha [Elusimicrobiota bacterium]
METIEQLREEARQEIAGLTSAKELEKLRIKYLGKKGSVTAILRALGSLSVEEKKKIGEKTNLFKNELENLIKEKEEALASQVWEKNLQTHPFDFTLPGKPFIRGSYHPITQIINQIIKIFQKLNFSVAEGPEVETDYYNFEALNMPAEHSARDIQDTFYLFPPKVLLRTHTSPVQIRVMANHQPPLRVVAPGRVYRHEAIDASHSYVFHQVEGFVVEQNVSFADLKSTLTNFLQQLFEADLPVRFRPSYFPFVEPGAEVDVRCFLCKGAGCRVCKNTGWVEIMGAGMIHTNIFKAVGYDPEQYSGFAFGMGIERIAMLKFGIDDMRLLYENDLRFLRQF